MTTIAIAMERIEERIQRACDRGGRKRSEVRLMGVSKFHALPEIEDARNAGLRLFGENRVQEAAEKFSVFKARRPETELHLIGPLQRNKAKAAVSLFDAIDSVDREALIDELGALASGRETALPILLELHTAEDTKSGFPNLDSLYHAAEKAYIFPGLALGGLMTMAPFTSDERLIRASFRALSAARDKLAARFPDRDWSCLSMGMSNDFEIAIEEGATLIRIGTALFGERHI
ncbi:MAG: YggS family pyridoxal phosphate-dependent enzyme [Treponema sp.]|jgi:pyridoxal phosphate enzyme (YggS family)|nr:YggS family pyridoxal phosphate-dependent enzyme [Treponema sp.]